MDTQTPIALGLLKKNALALTKQRTELQERDVKIVELTRQKAQLEKMLRNFLDGFDMDLVWDNGVPRAKRREYSTRPSFPEV
jgi:hypothetical protein